MFVGNKFAKVLPFKEIISITRKIIQLGELYICWPCPLLRDRWGDYMRNRIIDYNVYGSDMQFVAIELGPSESVVAEAGGMMLMEDGIEMETIFGDGSQSSQGLVDKLVSAGQRWLTRESLFMTLFTNTDPEERRVYFAAPYPGKIEAVDLDQVGGELICQKDAFLCAERGVSVGIALQRKLGVGLFGGEGFIMQRLTGNGLAFIHAGGTLHRRTLEYREKLRVDTG